MPCSWLVLDQGLTRSSVAVLCCAVLCSAETAAVHMPCAIDCLPGGRHAPCMSQQCCIPRLRAARQTSASQASARCSGRGRLRAPACRAPAAQRPGGLARWAAHSPAPAVGKQGAPGGGGQSRGGPVMYLPHCKARPGAPARVPATRWHRLSPVHSVVAVPMQCWSHWADGTTARQHPAWSHCTAAAAQCSP